MPWSLALAAILTLAATRRASAGEPAALRLGDLVVTKGEIRELAGGRLSIDAPEVRAVARGGRGDAARVRFTYLGPTDGVAPLASGEVRRQIALKLRAQDGCNVLYVAWRVEGGRGVVVSVKSNPGKATHAECGARGYAGVRPRTRRAAPAIAAGTEHELAASLTGRELTVVADGGVVWQGAIPAAAFAFDGPIGLRTDDARFVVELRPGSVHSGAGL